ncbi:MAG TPA: Rv3654c family TadE-like protein [Nocardioidaceae bacterium]|nr:Rv3654c family TadE-like protein [Nocardioidaceae bacterium]
MTTSATADPTHADSAADGAPAPEIPVPAVPAVVRPGRHRGQRGSAALLVVGLLGVLTGLAFAGAVVGGLLVAQRRAAAAADLAALAGAEALAPGGVATVPTGSGCGRAARVGRENGAQLTGCSVEGREIVVRVAVDVTNPFGGTWEVPAVARAGPAVRWPTGEGGSDP